MSDGKEITFVYKNWRGEVSTRTVTPRAIWFSSTIWHPEPQWLLTAFDHEKQADRDFALADISSPDLQARLEEAERHKRLQADDIMTLGQQVGAAEATLARVQEENRKLREALKPFAELRFGPKDHELARSLTGGQDG